MLFIHGLPNVKESSLLYQEPSIVAVLCDLTDWDGTRKAVEGVGPIHLLVNSAGVAAITPFLDVTKQELDW